MDKQTHERTLKKIMFEHGYKYKFELENRLKSIRSTYSVGDTIGGKDHDLLASLLQLHHRHNRCVPTRFTITLYSLYRVKCTAFNDETSPTVPIAFSTRSCTNHSEHTKKHHINVTFRNLIVDQIEEFRQNERAKYANVSFTCPLSNKTCSYNSTEVHIDHDKHCLPFRVLVDNFLDTNGLQDKDLTNVMDQNTGLRTFTNQLVTRGWQDYHRANCSLQSISREANLSSRY